MKSFSQLIQTRRTYRSDELDEFVIDSEVRKAKLYKDSKKIQVYNVPAAFDIETSSFYEGKQKRACMYIWMLGLNGLVMTGRTWEEFREVCDGLSDLLGLGSGRQLYIYVHNLEFEFQWIRHRFEWAKVFATGPRTPAYALTTTGICFRCSYILSGYSLETVGRALHTYKVLKASGDLDYRLIRNSLTPLDEKEMGYCIADVKVVMAYIQEHIETDGNIVKILTTKTSYVRQLCRNACLYPFKSHKKGGLQTLKFQQYIGAQRIIPEEYVMLKRGLQGGFTHASYHYSGKTLFDVGSNDIASDFPYQICSQKFPASSGEFVQVRTMSDLRRYLNCYCCLFDVEFFGLVAKDDIYEHPISCSKCWELDPDHIEDNGRLVEASHLKTTITDVDFQIYEKFYSWESMAIGKFIIYRRARLPKPFIKTVLELYQKKTTLKGVPGLEIEYGLAKENINSCYGSMVTDIVRPEITYGTEWTEEQPDLAAALEKYNNDRRRYSCYTVGIWITAYARRQLFEAIYYLGPDYVYSDTDSVKYLHPEKHTAFFETVNMRLAQKAVDTCNYYGLDPELTRPFTIKGKQKPLGIWEFEGIYKRFKTLGAKRYMVETEDGISITVSGVNKHTALPYICRGWAYDLRRGRETFDPFKRFTDQLVVPPEASGKLTHTYIDDAHEGIVTDYIGTEAPYQEYSAVHLEPAPYELSLSSRYIDYLQGVRERSK